MALIKDDAEERLAGIEHLLEGLHRRIDQLEHTRQTVVAARAAAKRSSPQSKTGKGKPSKRR